MPVRADAVAVPDIMVAPGTAVVPEDTAIIVGRMVPDSRAATVIMVPVRASARAQALVLVLTQSKSPRYSGLI